MPVGRGQRILGLGGMGGLRLVFSLAMGCPTTQPPIGPRIPGRPAKWPATPQLQSARTLLLERARRGSEGRRLAAAIGSLLDAFDALIAAQGDVAVIRRASASAKLLRHVRAATRVGALDLDGLGLEILTTSRPTLPPDHQLAVDALARETSKLEQTDARDSALAALGAAARRLILALGHIRRLEKALSDGRTAEMTIAGIDLAAFLPQRLCSLAALAPHLTVAWPVLRYSVRLSLAMMAGAVVVRFLGDSAHGDSVPLTISVIMRANYGLTKRRRDDRVLGALLAASSPRARWLGCRQASWSRRRGLSFAVTHSLIRLNYMLTSVGASVTAPVSL